MLVRRCSGYIIWQHDRTSVNQRFCPNQETILVTLQHTLFEAKEKEVPTPQIS